MEIDYLQCPVVLDREKSWSRAAAACLICEDDLASAIPVAETGFANPMVKPGSEIDGFPAGQERVLAWAEDFNVASET